MKQVLKHDVELARQIMRGLEGQIDPDNFDPDLSAAIDKFRAVCEEMGVDLDGTATGSGVDESEPKV